MRSKKQRLITMIISVVALVAAYFIHNANQTSYSDSVADVPEFSGDAYIIINNNEPEFTQDDMTAESYEYYSQLDHLGRCGYAMACIGTDLMPTEERESISHVKPSGWIQAQYDFVDGESLYNRCHLIGFQLTGENANERNLITGTRYLNVEGMLPFENMVADYIKETGNHVLYRVTPIFIGDNLVASGVQMEAKSVEDSGDGICFHVYAYNNQPGVSIDYTTGESVLSGGASAAEGTTSYAIVNTYILNTGSKKFHTEDCGQAQDISRENREEYTGDRKTLIDDGYTPAGCCHP